MKLNAIIRVAWSTDRRHEPDASGIVRSRGSVGGRIVAVGVRPGRKKTRRHAIVWWRCAVAEIEGRTEARLWL